jgi:hypothetical protein
MFDRFTIRDVIDAFSPLAGIPRPDTDNEGDPINANSILPYLSPMHAQQASHAVTVAYQYARTVTGDPDRRALNTMARHGFPASLGPAQYEPDRMVGSVTVGDWWIDISDPSSGRDYD